MSDGNGLYYMRARFYSPSMKRFVNRDVLLGDVGEGQSLNRLAYVSGRPVSLVDPFGLAQEEIDRAADIVKTFLPHLYNNLAMPKIGSIPYNWLIKLMQYAGLDWATSGYTDEFGYITINSYFYSSPLFPFLKRKLSPQRRIRIEQNLEDLLATVIHEYIHSYDYQENFTNYLLKTDPYFSSGIYGLVSFFGRHRYIYDRSRVLAGYLKQYMFLTHDEWNLFKTDPERVKFIQESFIPILSWSWIPGTDCF